MASAARLNASTARLRGAAVEERKRKIAEASQVKSLMEKDESVSYTHLTLPTILRV